MSTSNSNEQTIFLFFTTGDEAELSEVHRLFRDFRHICVETVLESPLLKGKMSLPFIESPDGQRYFGVSGIRSLAQQLAS